MREIISIYVGQAGVQIGDCIYTLLAQESGLDANGVAHDTDDVNTSLFTETSKGTWTPRCIFIDSEPAVVDEVYVKSKIKNTYTREFFVSGQEDAFGCFAEAKFHNSRTLLPPFVCSFRRALEECEGMNCLRSTQSLSGGTGSGLGTTILYVMDDVIPKVSKHMHSIIPSANVEPAPTSVYNAVLALAQTETLHNIRFVYDNETMTNLLNPLFEQSLGSNHVTYRDINLLPALVSSCLSINAKITAGEMDLIQLSTNLICYRHMKMVSPAFVPLQLYESQQKHNAFSIASDAFNKNHEMCSLDTQTGEYLSCWLLFRGDYDDFEIHKAKKRICHPTRQMDIQFKDWIPKFVKQGHIKARPQYLYDFMHRADQCLLKVSNHSNIMAVQDDMLQQYRKLLENRAFVFHYTGAGMEEGEFTEAIETIQDTMDEFQKSAGSNGSEE